MEQNSSKVLAEAASPVVTTSGTGSALFVINLCASMAPIATAGKTLPGLESYRLYQVARAEDGRTRHRLRLGFFVSEADAEKTLATVRSQYPTAFTACLADEDRKFARGFITEAAPSAPAPKPQMSVVVDNDSTRPLKALRITAPPAEKPAVVVPAPAAKSAPKVTPPATRPAAATPAPVAKPAAAAATPAIAKKPGIDESAIVEFDWEPPAAPAAPAASVAKAAAPATPTKVAPPARPAAEAVEIEMTWEPPAARKQAAAPPPAAPPVASSGASNDASKPATRAVAAAPAATVPAAPAPVKVRQEMLPKVTPPAAAPVPAKATAPAPNKQASLELAATSAPLSNGTGQHRGIVATLTPSRDSMDLSLVADPAPTAVAGKASPPAVSQPFHVGKGIEVPTTSLTLDVEKRAAANVPAPAAKPAPAPAAPHTSAPAAKTGPDMTGLAQALVKAKAAAPPPRQTAIAAEQRPTRPHAPTLATADLDSTQTIRALTDAELNDDSQEKWFAIQLVVSEQPVNLEAMPHLDIFEAYRLYSIATAGSGRITHSLRIGFFREQVSAEAVSGYLKTFFPSPSIVRISVAEQARFKDPPESPAASAAPAQDGKDGKIVALSDARAKSAKPVIPTVTMAVEPATDSSPTGSFRPNATGSFKPNATGSFKPNATGSFKPHATGSFKPDATGSFKPNATGSFKPGATGSYKAVKTAAKSSVPVKRSSAAIASSKKSATGKHPALPKKRLSEELMDEAREVELTESGIFQVPKNGSLLARLVDKLSK